MGAPGGVGCRLSGARDGADGALERLRDHEHEHRDYRRGFVNVGGAGKRIRECRNERRCCPTLTQRILQCSSEHTALRQEDQRDKRERAQVEHEGYQKPTGAALEKPEERIARAPSGEQSEEEHHRPRGDDDPLEDAARSKERLRTRQIRGASRLVGLDQGDPPAEQSADVEDPRQRMSQPNGWRPYFSAALDQPRVLSERKTGVYRAQVVTAQLAQDERGWLRIA